MSLESEFTAELDNYFMVSGILVSDMNSIVVANSDSGFERRNIIRSFFSLVDGYLNCFRQLALVLLKVEDLYFDLSNKERKALLDEKSLGTSDRIKYLIIAFCKILDLKPRPDFSGDKWCEFNHLVRVRHSVTHPKNANDLLISNEEWDSYCESIKWGAALCFDVTQKMANKYS
ncbi:hypothetical protein [Thalassotalea montiporae]